MRSVRPATPPTTPPTRTGVLGELLLPDPVPAVEDGAAPALVAEPIPPAPMPGLFELLATLDNCVEDDADVANVVEGLELAVENEVVPVGEFSVVTVDEVSILAAEDVSVVVVGNVSVVGAKNVPAVVVVVVVVVVKDVADVAGVADVVNDAGRKDVELPKTRKGESEDVRSELFLCVDDWRGGCAEVAKSVEDEVDWVALSGIPPITIVSPFASVKPLGTKG